MKKSLPLFFGFIISIVVGLAISQDTFAGTTPVNNYSLAPMLEKAMPSVVNINIRGEIGDDESLVNMPGPVSDDDGANPPRRKFESLGSGVIMDAEHGYIATNAHLLRKANVITVKLSDGRSFKAKLIGLDAPSDLAVIQIRADNLHALPFADSDKLHVGDFVAAIGNPFGLSQTVTSGIISGLQRNDLRIEGYENFIQTDAPINPGNSGGALVNMKGELIGINTAILTPMGGNIGISFAIPTNMAKSVTEQLIQYGTVRRGLMGVLVQNLTPELAAAFHISYTQGAVVTLVTPGSPAEKAGVQVGDIIQEVNGMQIKDSNQVRNIVGLLRAGSSLKVKVLRQNKTMNLSLETADPKAYQQESEAKYPFLFGVALRDFDEQTASGRDIRGVEVVNLSQNSAAFAGGLGIHPGDVILSANQQPVKNVAELKQIAQKSSDQLLLNVLRQGGALFVVLSK